MLSFNMAALSIGYARVSVRNVDYLTRLLKG